MLGHELEGDGEEGGVEGKGERRREGSGGEGGEGTEEGGREEERKVET